MNTNKTITLFGLLFLTNFLLAQEKKDTSSSPIKKGDVCIKNNIVLFAPSGNIVVALSNKNGNFQDTLKIPENNSSCRYELPVGVYIYKIFIWDFNPENGGSYKLLLEKESDFKINEEQTTNIMRTDNAKK